MVGETESSSRAVGDVGHNSRAPGETIPSPHVMNEAAPATPQKTEKVLAAPDNSAVSAVTKIASPSQEEVDEVHQRFKVALKNVFDRHKHLMPGWHAKELLIV